MLLDVLVCFVPHSFSSFLFVFPLGNFYWPVFMFPDSFLSRSKSAEEPVGGILRLCYCIFHFKHFHLIFFIVSTEITQLMLHVVLIMINMFINHSYFKFPVSWCHIWVWFWLLYILHMYIVHNFLVESWTSWLRQKRLRKLFLCLETGTLFLVLVPLVMGFELI